MLHVFKLVRLFLPDTSNLVYYLQTRRAYPGAIRRQNLTFLQVAYSIAAFVTALKSIIVQAPELSPRLETSKNTFGINLNL